MASPCFRDYHSGMETLPDAKQEDYGPYELWLLILTLLSLVAVVLLFLPSVSEQIKLTVRLFDTVISFLFLGDFLYHLYQAEDKRAYLKWGWLDLLGSLPALPTFRIFRLFRIYRALRILRRLGARAMLKSFIERRAESTLMVTLLIVTLLVIGSSFIILRTEATSASANIETSSDAIWWAFVTMTTVGYGDHYPTTDTGRLIAAVLMTAGVGLFGVLTSFLATSFLTPRETEQDQQLAEIRAELAEIKRLLQEKN
ncbi:MAG: potassium channel family protein [Chloroflexota bacterium]